MRCKNCRHLIRAERTAENGKPVYKHKQSNHSFYCPCRKPEPADKSDDDKKK